MWLSTVVTVSASAISTITWLNPTPHRLAVYASAAPLPVAPATLATRRLATPYLGGSFPRWIALTSPSARRLRPEYAGTFTRCPSFNVIEPDSLAYHWHRGISLEPPVTVERRRGGPECHSRQADHDPTGRRLIPLHFGIGGKTILPQIRLSVQPGSDLSATPPPAPHR